MIKVNSSAKIIHMAKTPNYLHSNKQHNIAKRFPIANNLLCKPNIGSKDSVFGRAVSRQDFATKN